MRGDFDEVTDDTPPARGILVACAIGLLWWAAIGIWAVFW